MTTPSLSIFEATAAWWGGIIPFRGIFTIKLQKHLQSRLNSFLNTLKYLKDNYLIKYVINKKSYGKGGGEG